MSIDKLFFENLGTVENDNLAHMLSELGFSNSEIKSNFIEKLYEIVKSKQKHFTHRVYNPSTRWSERWPYGERDYLDGVVKQIKQEFWFRNTILGDVKWVRPDGVEVISKRMANLAKPIVKNKFVTATGIASYVFCPVSYCIKSSFDEDEASQESLAGIELHEEQRLVAPAKGQEGQYHITDSGRGKGFYNQQNIDFFDDIRNSEIAYVGHGQANKHYFKSSKGKLVGQPDYVFVNKHGVRFVVEEKFRPLVKQSSIIKEHHQAQLASYILGLDELNAKYGYLVYWYYIYNDEKRIVKKCVVFKIEPTDKDREGLRKSYRAVNALNEGERLKFATNELNAAKCASCVVCKFCGHKTGRFNEIAVPYEKEFYKLTSEK